MKLSAIFLAGYVQSDTLPRATDLEEFAHNVGLNVTSLGNWNNDFFESRFLFDTKDMSLDAGWELCWDNPYPPGKNEEEHAQARRPEGLQLDKGSLHWIAGTHRCFKGTEALDASNNEFIIPARHYILSKAGYFNNYYIKSANNSATIDVTLKLNEKFIEDDIDGSSTSFVTPFTVSLFKLV